MGKKPCRDSPLGNPPYPGTLASEGANWPVYITTTYNQSLIETYNFARYGATVDNVLIPHLSDFVQQLQGGFLRHFNDQDDARRNPSNSLFATFFGVNDVIAGLELEGEDKVATLFDKEFKTYASLVDKVRVCHQSFRGLYLLPPKLYGIGARNFLFMNAPPVERTPHGYPAFGIAAEAWNARLVDMANNLSKTCHDTTVFQFDTHSFFNQVIDQPRSFPETALYKNTTEYCAMYADGTKN